METTIDEPESNMSHFQKETTINDSESTVQPLSTTKQYPIFSKLESTASPATIKSPSILETSQTFKPTLEYELFFHIL
jgi:hypothetical protein